MGAYDDLEVKRINDENFNHNDTSFQTKDLDQNLELYVIDNNMLFIMVERGKPGEFMKKINYTGTLNIYTGYPWESWIEYDLKIEKGQIVGCIII